MHESETADQIRAVGEHQSRQFRVVGLPRLLDALGRRRILFLVLHEVMVLGWDVGLVGALEAVGVLAVRDDADNACGQLAGACLVNDSL